MYRDNIYSHTNEEQGKAYARKMKDEQKPKRCIFIYRATDILTKRDRKRKNVTTEKKMDGLKYNNEKTKKKRRNNN